MLDKVERINKGEDKLLDLVTAIRDGKIDPCEQDPTYLILKSRFPCNISESDLDNFKNDKLVHLWYCKKPVKEYNMKKIKQLSTPVALIKAVHPEGDKESASANEEDAGGLEA